jgi:hypothetical protein
LLTRGWDVKLQGSSIHFNAGPGTVCAASVSVLARGRKREARSPSKTKRPKDFVPAGRNTQRSPSRIFFRKT